MFVEELVNFLLESDPDFISDPEAHLREIGLPIERKATRRLQRLGLEVFGREGMTLFARYVGNPPRENLPKIMGWWVPQTMWKFNWLNAYNNESKWSFWAQYMLSRIRHVLNGLTEKPVRAVDLNNIPEPVISVRAESHGNSPYDYVFKIKIRIQ